MRPVRTALAGLAALGCAALVAAPAPASAAASGTVCNKYCDARDPSNAPKDRVPVTAAIYGRQIQLHLDDTDAMGWASIGSGDPGDEVWLDRSFDGGRTWDSGSKLGDTKTPDGSRGWRTQMYNVDDWGNQGVGALRACGKAGNRDEIACTPWARSDWNAWSRSTAAATGLMMMYDRSNGLFESNGWWTSANALTAIIDNADIAKMPSYTYAIAKTYDANINAQEGQFRNDYLDDTGWWGLAWVRAYDVTGDHRYLDTARADADHMNDNWTAKCGGGVQWNETKPYKNAITNELFLELNAALHNRIGGDSQYLDRAKKEWAWFTGSGMINKDHLINDGLDDSCANNGQTTWTYNQGVVLGGLAELHKATGDDSLLTAARTLADASTGSASINPGGILADPGEGTECSGDGQSFKGAYVRGLSALDKALPGQPYQPYLDKQADAAYAHDRNTLDQYGRHWAGPMGDTHHGCQQSALDLLNAATQK